MRELLRHFGKKKIGLVKKIQMRIKKLFGFGGRDLVFKGNILDLERAPEPSDILWKNCEQSFKLSRIVAIYSVTVLIILVSFGMIIGLEFLQNYVKKNSTKFDN